MNKKLEVLAGGFDEDGNPLYLIKDTTDMIGNIEICKKVIEQQAKIKEQNKEIEDWEFSFRTEMAHHRVAEKELKEKIKEQQDTIDKQELRLQHLEELLELSENLNKSYREKLIGMKIGELSL